MDLSLRRLEEAVGVRRQIDALEQRLAALVGGGRSTSTSTSSKRPTGRRTMSAATRAKIARKLQELPGQELFQYLDEEGELRDVTSQDVNAYLHEITGQDFTAKDFRTWAGTVLIALALSAQKSFKTKKEAKANVRDAITAVSKILGNTPAVCRKCYVHPVVLESYLDGNLIAGLKMKTEEGIEENLDNLRSDEIAILRFLRRRLDKKAP